MFALVPIILGLCTVFVSAVTGRYLLLLYATAALLAEAWTLVQMNRHAWLTAILAGRSTPASSDIISISDNLALVNMTASLAVILLTSVVAWSEPVAFLTTAMVVVMLLVAAFGLLALRRRAPLPTSRLPQSLSFLPPQVADELLNSGLGGPHAYSLAQAVADSTCHWDRRYPTIAGRYTDGEIRGFVVGALLIVADSILARGLDAWPPDEGCARLEKLRTVAPEVYSALLADGVTDADITWYQDLGFAAAEYFTQLDNVVQFQFVLDITKGDQDKVRAVAPAFKRNFFLFSADFGNEPEATGFTGDNRKLPQELRRRVWRFAQEASDLLGTAVGYVSVNAYLRAELRAGRL